MKRTIKVCVQSILLAVLMVQTCFVALADSTLTVEITEGSHQISLTNLPVGIYATEITLHVTEGDLEQITFVAESAYDGFLNVNEGQSITLYVVSGTVMNNDTNTVHLGEFLTVYDLEFSSASVKIVNFLQYSEAYASVPVIYVVDPLIVPDVEEENNDAEEESDVYENEDIPEAEEESSSGGNFATSSGGSYSSNSDKLEEESQEAEESGDELNQETQERYEVILQTYGDVETHWAKENILYVMDKGYFKGISATEFAPNQSMTRAMFVTVMHSVDGGYFTTDISYFQDMKQEDWFYVYVSWAVANGITTGVSETHFNPDGAVTREQMALMVYNYIQSKGYALEQTEASTPFVDGDSISAWAVNGVDYIRQCGIISGKTGNLFDPQGIATRAEVATIIRNLMELIAPGHL